MNIIRIVLFMSILSLVSIGFGQPKADASKIIKSDHLTLNFSVFHPLSINTNDDINTNVNISMLYGHVGSVSGVELSGLINKVNRDVVGVEMAGIANLVGTETRGFQVAGIVNLQESHFQGMQVSGVVNMVGGDFTGFQTAGVVNLLNGDLEGLQLSPGNISRNVNGVQIGVVNIGAKVSGVQIGVINIVDEIEGVPIGIINYSKKGRIHAVAWGSNIILNNVGVKFAVNDHFYSILSGGYNNRSRNVSKSLAVGYFMGLHFPLEGNIYLDTDIGGYTVDNEKFFKSEEGIKNQNMLQARVVIGYELMEKISVFAGIGGNYTVNNRQKFKDGKSETMFMAGLQLF